MPKPEDLPEPLRPLIRRQACELSDTRFDSDVTRLIEAIAKDFRDANKEPVPYNSTPLPEGTTLLKKRLGLIASLFLRVLLFAFNAFFLWIFIKENYPLWALLSGTTVFLLGGSFIRQLRYRKNPYILLSLSTLSQLGTMAAAVLDSRSGMAFVFISAVPTLLTGWLAWYHLTER